MGACQSNPASLLSSDGLTSQINQFFTGMAIRKLGVGSVMDGLKSSLFGGGGGNALGGLSGLSDLSGMKTLLGNNLANKTFAKTTKDFVGTAMEEATNMGDKTLPFKSLLLMADSDKSTFTNAFKAFNVAQQAKSSLGGVTNLLSGGNATGGGLGNMVSGLGQNLGGLTNIAKTAANPSLVPSTDLKNLSSYYTNMMTLMPVKALAKNNEGVGVAGNYVTKALTSAFSKNAQNNFVDNTLMSKFKGQNSINVDDFFDSNYSILKDDNALRKGMCDTFLKNLTPTALRSIVGNQGSGGFC